MAKTKKSLIALGNAGSDRKRSGETSRQGLTKSGVYLYLSMRGRASGELENNRLLSPCQHINTQSQQNTFVFSSSSVWFFYIFTLVHLNFSLVKKF